jgi:UPF0755 protein
VRAVAAGVAALGVAALAAGAASLLRAPARSGAPAVVFAVPKGAALARVTADLEAAGLVRSAAATEWLARLRGDAGALRAGEYDVSPAWSAGRVLDELVSGRVKTYPVVLPEGVRAAEIASRLEAAGLAPADRFLQAVRDSSLARSLGVPGQTLEGYLFPETYRLPRGMSADAIAGAMVQQFFEVWREVEALGLPPGLSLHQTVTLASLVEKETGVAEERPLIAAVFLNRLRRGMRLETDPSVIYGIESFDGNLRRSDLRDARNPYNTYAHFGLPPGPIASPGRDALLAVVRPAPSEYLYFVSRNDGSHQFSRTYREHVNAVNRYQKRSSR